MIGKRLAFNAWTLWATGMVSLLALVAAAGAPDGALRAHSMVTRDGRRLVSTVRDGRETFELVATNALPKDLPPPRPWTFYVLKATHTDIGLHNPQYVQRHGTVRRIEDAARLIDADRRADDDPAAYRYVMEGAWFWDNYCQDRGEAAARRIVTNYIARGRMDVGVTCAGNHTHLFSKTELERSTLTKRRLAEKWGIGTKTFIMADNPGLSWSVVKPYAQAGIRYGLFLPNQWNPILSTIWTRNTEIHDATWNPDAMGGGARVEVSYDSPLPMLFRWESPDGDASLLIWCSTQYGYGLSRLGLRTNAGPGDVGTAEAKMPGFLGILERKYPYDVWFMSNYGDDEPANTGTADFAAAWNAKWAIPEFRTVGRLDEPFERVERKFGDRIPVLRGEMTSGWLQHAASTPELLADKLNADRMLATAERLGAFAGTLDRLAVDQAWWYLILNDEHSYGTSGYQGRRVFETWLQHRDWIARAAATASNELAKATAKLGLEPRTDDRVEVRPGTTGENAFYRVAVNGRGEITSLYDKELKRELLEGTANRFLYTRDNHRTWADESALGATIVRRVFLPRDVRRVEIVDTFEHARDLFNTDRYRRYGYLAFPFAVPDGAFRAQLAGGEVIRPYEDCHPMTTDAFTAVRDWCAVENGDFGVALMMRDSTLTEFGEIHPDKTCYTGRPPKGSAAVYPYLFADWLQMHQPDGDSMNFTFRFAITSYATRGGARPVAERCADWLDPYAAWMRAHRVGEVTRTAVAEAPRNWTGLVDLPRAVHGERDGQMYLEWGAEMSPDFDHYDLFRDGRFLAAVTNETYGGIPYRVARYVDLGLPTHSRHAYRVEKVFRDGRREPHGGEFSWTTRFVDPFLRDHIRAESETTGSLTVRLDGATAVNWRPRGFEGDEAFFLPEKRPWGREVHGGLPICWPWFGKAGTPKHGLVRYLRWEYLHHVGKDRVVLRTRSTEATRKLWPHDFELTAEIALTGPNELQLALTERNTGTDAFESECGIHPYFRVADAERIGFGGEALPKPWVIREWKATSPKCALVDLVKGRRLEVSCSDAARFLIWNPGVERTPLCEGLESDDWKRFYCLEAVSPRRSLAPGGSRTVRFTLSLVNH